MRVLLTLNTKLMYFSEIEEHAELSYDEVRRALIKLTERKLVDTESFKWKTLYKLTPDGIKILENRADNIRFHNGDMTGKKLYIQGIEFETVEDAKEHLQHRLEYYKDGDLMKTEDFSFVYNCLYLTEKGLELIETGIFNIQVVVENCTYFLKIVTDTDDYDTIPLDRLLGERKIFYHNKDVRKAFYNAVDNPPEGYSIQHGEPHFNKIYKNFFKLARLNQTDLDVKRINNKEELIDTAIKNRWVEYYKKHANIRLITIEEVEKAQKAGRIEKLLRKTSSLPIVPEQLNI